MESRPALFRQEAIDFQQHHRQWGDVASLQPISIKIVAWVLLVFSAAIVAFLIFAQYSRKETVVGYLTPAAGTAKIFAPQRGTIKKVHVREGQQVREGQPLLDVETNQIAADGIDVNTNMLETLTAQKELLAKNIAGEEHRAGSERERLTSSVRGLRSEIAQLEGQIKIQTERLRVSEAEAAAGDELRSKGIMTQPEFRRRQLEMLQQKQALAALNQQLASRENQLTDTEFSLQELPTVMAQKIQLLRNDLSATDQRIAEINGRRAYVIRAPRAAVFRPCRPPSVRTPIPSGCNSRSFRKTQCFRLNCLCRPGQSASSGRGRRLESFMTPSPTSILAAMAPVWWKCPRRS
jgi:membrane fusion protein